MTLEKVGNLYRWWQQRKMRWAVKRHRQIHSQQRFLMSPCRQYLMMARGSRLMKMAIWKAPMGAGMGDTIVWRKLSYGKGDSRPTEPNLSDLDSDPPTEPSAT